jgi:Uncharacterized conserved protein
MEDIRGPDLKEQAKKDYLKGIKYKELAEKYNVSLNTIKSWKQRYKWERKSVHTKESKDNKSMHTSRGAPKGNKNSVGHASSVPKQNKNAETHGFFSKYLPEDTFELINEIQEKNPLDIMWENITIQYAAIIRAQRLMYVNDKNEMFKEIKKTKGIPIKSKDKRIEILNTEIEYEFQFAWDRQATFLNAQSRAMATLQNMIRNYDEMLNKNWDLATEEQKLRIEKLKVEIEKVNKNPDEEKPIEIIIKRKGEI